MKKEKTINLNGTFYSSGKIIHSSNRAFLYGDSVFETIRFQEDVLLWELHFARLLRAAAALGFVFSPWWTEDYFRYELRKTMNQNRIQSGKIRLVLFREEEANGYAPTSDRCSYLIDPEPMEEKAYSPHAAGLKIGIFDADKKHISPYSFFKCGQSLLYVMAARHARKEFWDEALILNQNDRICESSTGNIWALKGNVITTSPITDGCIDGIMRSHLMAILPEHGLEVEEKSLEIGLLEQADEIWISNAVHGIRWVSQWDFRQYTGNKAQQYQSIIQKEITNHDKENRISL